MGWLYNTLKFKILQLQRERYKVLQRCIDLDSVPELSTEMPFVDSLDIRINDDLQLLVQFYVDG